MMCVVQRVLGASCLSALRGPTHHKQCETLNIMGKVVNGHSETPVHVQAAGRSVGVQEHNV